MRPKGLITIGMILCVCDGGLAQEWPTYVNETEVRMPTGPGMNDPAVTTFDPDDKNYAWGDVDKDGDTDLVCVRKLAYVAGRRRNVLFLNEGIAEGHAINGVLVDRSAQFAAEADDGGQGFLDLTDDRDVALVDVDGDEWLDIVTTTTYGQGLAKTISHPRIYMNKGELAGQWLGFRYEMDRTPTLPIAPNFCGVGFGDVTGDGFPDLYQVDYENNLEDRLWINDGTGHFTDQSTLRMTFQMLESEFGTHTVIADLNGDGVKDIIKDRSNGAPYRISISYNDPDNEGFFDEFEVVYNGAPYYVEVADLNNDDRLDIVLQDDGIDRYLLNQGNGLDGLANWLLFSFPPQSNGFEGTMELADMNNDGFVDVLITDEAVNSVGTACARRMHIWRNLGDVPNVTFEEATEAIPLSALSATSDVAPIDLNGDGWRDMVIGTCSGTAVWMSQPPIGVNYMFPNGIPTIAAPNQDTTVEVELSPFGESLDPTSPLAHISVNGGVFESMPMTLISGNLYRASLGQRQCSDRISLYFSARLNSGATFTDPIDAPATTYHVMIADSLDLVLEDNIEGSISGWTIASDPALTTGRWEQADPNGTIQSGDFAAPDDDATDGPGNVLAFVTENGAPGALPGANDIDGGATYLTSPSLDLQGVDARISYARWFFTAFGATDSLIVEISNDGGSNWVLAAQVNTTGSAWDDASFVVGEFVQPTADVVVRFTASDFDSSITEAGIDNFRVEVFNCLDSSIPAASSWGLVVMALLLLTTGTLVLDRRSLAQRTVFDR